MANLTGGCQCGAVRYEWVEKPAYSSVCYCRMCQKASGQPFMGLTGGKKEHLHWTRGAPSVFRSSNMAERGFCRDCGTPLYNNWIANDVIHPATATLDDPSALKPEFQMGVEAKLAWVDAIPGLTPVATDDAFKGYEALLEEIKRTNYQHPDHDTAEWPPRT